ncbi:MAG TPA: cytochrome d ubiquinol oxidase subunit II, partial [Acidobacteriaceae bacterium]
LMAARSQQERRQALASIGPVWDGNEVWLLAGGGTLFFAFPMLYASSFSGFYLPLMMVLWLLMLRGISLELRHHSTEPVWRALLDGIFVLANVLLAIFYGAALANVVRGVPIGADGYFFLPLWTDWRTGPAPGILDWYTVLGGVLALAALATHGACWLAMKTTGKLELRAQGLARKLTPLTGLLTIVSIPATVVARPASLANYQQHPVLYLAPALVAAGLWIAWSSLKRGATGRAFAGMTAYLAGMMVGAAVGVYPVLLPNVAQGGHDLTIENALAGEHTLHVGLVWWTLGILLAIGYFATVYWLFRGKVNEDAEGYGH